MVNLINFLFKVLDGLLCISVKVSSKIIKNLRVFFFVINNLINFLFKVLKGLLSIPVRIISNVLKKLRVFFRSNKNLILLLAICCISFSLFILFSLALAMMWLFFPSIYFKYNKRYENIFIIWGFLFLSWYLVFIGCMVGFDGSIVVTGDLIGNWIITPRRVPYEFLFVTDKFPLIYLNYTFLTERFRSLCIDSLLFLSLLSSTLGCPIYIPSVYKGLAILYKLIFRG